MARKISAVVANAVWLRRPYRSAGVIELTVPTTRLLSCSMTGPPLNPGEVSVVCVS